MTSHRVRIERYVAATPGVHFNGLVRALDLAPGQVQHHLKALRGDTIVEEQLYGRTHYYSSGYGDRERRLLALARRETTRDVLIHLEAHEPVRPATVADRLAIARSTLEWHLGRLTGQDLIEKQYDSHNHVHLRVRDPEEVKQLLAEIDPSFAERMTDRFTRLTDQVLHDVGETNE